MKHLICGVGVVGKATGTYLEANSEEVWYYDKNDFRLKNIKNCIDSLISLLVESFDILWICAPETAVEDILKKVPKLFKLEKIIVVRSTTIPGTLEKLETKYKITNLVHNPEFLRESNAIEDTFNPDRIVVGASKKALTTSIFDIYKSIKCAKYRVSLTESELIKQISNAWLATQISFWNEIKELCDSFSINSQTTANIVTKDKRISKYGSIMTGKAFGGHCLPKDLEHLIECFENQNLNSYVLHMVRNKNDMLRSKE